MANKKAMKTVTAANPTVSRFVRSVEDEMQEVSLKSTDAVKNYIEMRAEDFLSSKENFSDEVWERIEWDAVLGRDILETFTQKALDEINLFSWVDDES